ncbi:MAG: hypothetical protein AAGG07_03045 [Planctomycetota bacterium]
MNEAPRILLAVAGLTVLAVLGSAAIAFVQARYKREQNGATEDGSMLDRMRAMVRRGEMSQEEFDAVRTNMAQRAVTRKTTGPSALPDRPRATRTGDGLRAPSGFDLTGAPLPTPQPGDPTGETNEQDNEDPEGPATRGTT